MEKDFSAVVGEFGSIINARLFYLLMLKNLQKNSLLILYHKLMRFIYQSNKQYYESCNNNNYVLW